MMIVYIDSSPMLVLTRNFAEGNLQMRSIRVLIFYPSFFGQMMSTVRPFLAVWTTLLDSPMLLPCFSGKPGQMECSISSF